MESGVLKGDALVNMLKAIGARKRSGVFELEFSGKHIRIVVSRGRIVEAYSIPGSPVQEVLQLLKRSQVIGVNFSSTAKKFRDLVIELSDLIAESELFAVNHERILSHLFSLPYGYSAIYTFKMEIEETDPTFASSVSVAQLLIDRESLAQGIAELDELFPKGAEIGLVGEPAKCSAEESLVVKALRARPLTLDDLRVRSLLSEFGLHDALMSLRRRGAVDLVEDNLGESQAEAEMLPDEASELGSSEAAQEGGANLELSPEDASNSSEDRWRLRVDRFADALGVVLLFSTLLAPFLIWRRLLERLVG